MTAEPRKTHKSIHRNVFLDAKLHFSFKNVIKMIPSQESTETHLLSFFHLPAEAQAAPEPAEGDAVLAGRR